MGGLGCSGLVHWQIAIAMLIAFLLLSSESYLATYTLSCFSTLAKASALRSHRDSHSADPRQPGTPAQPLCNGVRAQDAAVRSGRNDRSGLHVCDRDPPHRTPYSSALPRGAAAMKTLIRWGQRWYKFNLVGAMGMGLQLASLALFNRWTAGHYLYASAAAVELTLLHNFVWHLHYTWSDRRDDSTCLAQFVRFHLSNGFVSMLGNLALMRLLVHDARLPLLCSNVIAILCCSVVNFCLGNNWAFASRQKGSINPPRPNGGISHMQTKLLSLFMACLALSAIASAQTPAIEQTSEKSTNAARCAFASACIGFCPGTCITAGVSICLSFQSERHLSLPCRCLLWHRREHLVRGYETDGRLWSRAHPRPLAHLFRSGRHGPAGKPQLSFRIHQSGRQYRSRPHH